MPSNVASVDETREDDWMAQDGVHCSEITDITCTKRETNVLASK